MPIFLTIEKTTDENLHTALALFSSATCHVDTHQEAYSDQLALFSDSFANCLAVIVHDADAKRGCLMHVHPVVSGGLHQQALFDFVDAQIERALAAFSDSSNIQIFLWKGLSYFPMKYNRIERSYADYAAERFAGRASVVDRLDRAQFSDEASIVYSPASGSVYLVASRHNGVFVPGAGEMMQGVDLKPSVKAKPAQLGLIADWMRFWRDMRARLPVIASVPEETRSLLHDR